MAKFYFTFGMNHLNKDFMPLGHHYVEVEAESENQARDMMFAARGGKWAFCYNETEKEKAIDNWSLKPQTLEQVAIDPTLDEHPSQLDGETYTHKE